MDQNTHTVRIRAGTLTVTPSRIIIERGRSQSEIPINRITSITFVRAARWWEIMFWPWLSAIYYGKMKFTYRGETAFCVKSIAFTHEQEPDILKAKELIEYYQRVPRPLDYRSH